MANKNKAEMGDFLQESVPSTVLPKLQANEKFIFSEKGKKCYIGMLLDTKKIGGINKKAINNKDIGGVLELIKSGQIDAYVTAELNEAGELLLIPTYDTLDRLGDYGVFKRVDGYEFVKLNDKLEITARTGIFGTYDQFREIATGSAKLKDFVTPEDVVLAGSPEDPTKPHNALTDIAAKAKAAAQTVANVAQEKVAPVVGSAVSKVKDKIAETTGVKDMVAPASKPEEKQAPASEQTAPALAPAEAPPMPEAPAEVNPGQQPENNNPDDNQEIVYTETMVNQTIERVFHADNLDLPLSSEPFDQLFTLNNHLIKFDTDQRDGYVNAELNRMAADANRDIMKLRADNIKKLREKYFILMGLRIQEIQNQLDIKNPSTQYGSLKASIDNTRTEAMSNIASKVEERQAKLNEDFNARMEDLVENAARQTRSDFKNRFQRQLNDDLANVEGQVKADIIAQHTAALNELYVARRSDALSILDLNITGVLNELTKEYQKMFEQENALYIQRADEMREYSKQLHIDDAKRLAVEEEHLRITNEVNDARAEAAAKIALIQKEFETANAALEARSQATIDQAENTTKLVREQMAERTQTLEQDKLILQTQLNEAMERADKAQEIVRADYEHRLEQANDDREQWKQALENYREQHKHNNKLAAILVVAIVISCLAGGFVAGGVYWNKIVDKDELSSSGESYEIKVLKPEVTGITAGDTADLGDIIADLKEYGNSSSYFRFDPTAKAFIDDDEFEDKYKDDIEAALASLPEGITEADTKSMYFDPVSKTYLSAESMAQKYTVELTTAIEAHEAYLNNGSSTVKKPAETEVSDEAETVVTTVSTEAEKPATTTAPKPAGTPTPTVTTKK